MVTGRVPFEGPTPSAVMHKHLKEPLTPPDHLNTKLTSGCGAMIETLLAKNRDDRYPSARELLADLDLLARKQPPQYAQPAVNADVFETLSTGQNIAPEPPPPAARKPASNGEESAPILAIILGVVAGLSVLMNAILLARH
jgi:serine/threonine-protein kinase